MKNFLTFLMILITTVSVSAETISTIQPYRNHYRQPKHYGYYNTLNRGHLSALEKYALRKNYSREADIKRLERLENLAFGSIQAGDIESRYRNVEDAILSRPQNVYKHNLLNRIGNYFVGQTTGLTPSLTNSFTNGSNSMYYPEYQNTRIDQYSNGIWGSRYKTYGNSYGTGSSIHILD